jgi:hypothetical protein
VRIEIILFLAAQFARATQLVMLYLLRVCPLVKVRSLGLVSKHCTPFTSCFVTVGTPDYPSGIPDMHTIHDPMISVSWIHISELITELHHPLQYRIIYLQLVTWPILIMPRRASFQTKQRIPSSVDDPHHAYYPTGNWLGDVPSSHRRRRTPHHRLQSLHNLAKLIARDKAVSTFDLYSQNHLKGERTNMQFGCSKGKGFNLVFSYLVNFSCRYSMSYDISISLLKKSFYKASIEKL